MRLFVEDEPAAPIPQNTCFPLTTGRLGVLPKVSEVLNPSARSAEAGRALAKDGGVKDTGGEIGAGFAGMAAVLLPQRRRSFAGDEGVPRVTDRRNGHPLVGRDRQVAVVDGGLHARVGRHSGLGPAVAPSPGEVKERSGASVADRADEPAGGRVHLRLAELFNGWNLTLFLEHDDVPGAGGERGRCGR